ncbi:MAG TPA: RodZ domain-containing protein [Syntrophales bacterium]|nr:RodZ domain-containing protein [Syntrophales bacterium]
MSDATKRTEEAKPEQGTGVQEYDLKSIREAKGLTLRDVFERTRISVANLSAIENGEFHLLPPPVFTKSFIKVYAKSLGVDGSLILARYEQYLESLKPVHRDVKIKEIPRSARLFLKTSLWGSLAIIIVGLLIFSVSTYETAIDVVKNQVPEQAHKQVTAKPDETAAPATSEAPAQTAVIPEKSSEETPQQVATPQPKPVTVTREAEEKPKTKQAAASERAQKRPDDSGETYHIAIAAKEPTWLRITAGEGSPYQVLLQPGEKIEKDASQFVIDVGNAGGIDIKFQGKSLGSLGDQGQVVHLKLP